MTSTHLVPHHVKPFANVCLIPEMGKEKAVHIHKEESGQSSRLCQQDLGEPAGWRALFLLSRSRSGPVGTMPHLGESPFLKCQPY